MKRWFGIFILVSIIVGSPLILTSSLAQDGCGKEAVMAAVDEAVQILQDKGGDGLQQINAIRFCGDNYVFVNDLKGKNLMHVNKGLIGKVLIGLKDDTGKRFFADFSEVARSNQADQSGETYYNGSGWVEYRWPKPGEKTFAPKLTYIKACRMGKDNVYVGAGIYK